MRLLFDVLRALGRSWTWKMAWRDCRSHRLRMLLFTSAIMVGVGALVAIRSFSNSAANSITEQARSLVGADLIIQTRQDLKPELKNYLESLQGEQALQQAVVTMASFPKQNGTCLAQGRSLTGGFPWYGELVAEPAEALAVFENGEGALVEKQLLQQFGVKAGDDVMVGGKTFKVAGALLEIPGESSVIGEILPRIVVKSIGDQEKLSGMTIFDQLSFKLKDDSSLEVITERLKELQEKHRFNFDTAETRTEKIGNRLSNLFSFLSLVGFIALLLGGVGVASSVHLYIRGKLQSVAMLHCVGARNSQTVAIYVLQAIIMGLAGGTLGALLGTVLQYIVPLAFGNLFPFDVSMRVDWQSVGLGIMVGVVCTFLFSLLPLIGVRRVSPLMTLRADLEPSVSKDPLRWLIYLLLLLGVMSFAILSTPKVIHGVLFTIALLIGLSVLYGTGRLLMWMLKHTAVPWLPYELRQGIKNLYRPGNQTCTLILCVGFGVYLIMSQYLADEQIVTSLRSADASNKPNLVLFGVRSDEVAGVKQLLKEHSLPVLTEEPIVEMFIKNVKGVPVSELTKKKDEGPGDHQRRWHFTRDFRVTSRAKLSDSETVVRGEFIGRMPEESKTIPISVESDMARLLGLALNDTIDFSCDGQILKAHVSSIRKVDWFRIQPNFFVVFPEGSLAGKSKLSSIVSRSSSKGQVDGFQLSSVRSFPNVWVIDLGTIVDTFSSIQRKMAFTVRFMALFSVATGLMVLISMVHNSRDQRLRENTLLRTLGASGPTVMRIMTVEYLMLGGLAATTGNLLALAVSWLFTSFIFSIPYHVEWLALLLSTATIVAVTLTVGLLNTASSNRRSPLEVLRNT